MARPTSANPTKTVAFRLEPELIEFLAFLRDHLLLPTTSAVLADLVRREFANHGAAFTKWKKKQTKNAEVSHG